MVAALRGAPRRCEQSRKPRKDAGTETRASEGRDPKRPHRRRDLGDASRWRCSRGSPCSRAQAMNAGLHPFEVVFLRNLFAVPCCCAAARLARPLAAALRADRALRLARRHLALSMQAWFYAISLIPIGEVTAISFLAPLFGTLGADLPARRARAHPALDGARVGFHRRHDHPAPGGAAARARARSARCSPPCRWGSPPCW